MSELFKRTHMCGTLNIENVEQEVVLNGWVAKRRNLGGLIFVDLRDKTGIVQVTFDDKIPAEVFEKADSLRSEYVVGVKGIVKERSAKNMNIPTGEIEVYASDLVIYLAEHSVIFVSQDLYRKVVKYFGCLRELGEHDCFHVVPRPYFYE